MGLAISSKLVRLMGGSIWVESRVDHGSTFHFTVRLALQGSEAATALPIDPVDLRDLPVLAVDDNATNRRILHETLLKWRMRPTVVASGREALTVLRAAAVAGTPFRLALLDVQMPEMDGFALAERIAETPDLGAPTVIMLSSAGPIEEARRSECVGIARYLTKPVRQSDLLDAMLEALERRSASDNGRRATHWTLLDTDRPARPAQSSDPPPQRLRLLLAEDNPVNQKLAVRLLEKRGHAIVVVGNGYEAVAAFDAEHFDLILMDVQMPEMDGFEATAAIRAREHTAGGHIPIVAMTAHAMTGDHERCLVAGMDGYLSKPIGPQKLYATIERLANRPDVERSPQPATSPTAVSELAAEEE